MNRIQLPYGDSALEVSLPKGSITMLTERESTMPEASVEALISRALEKPYGVARLSRLVHSGQKVAIIVSAITRPCPTSSLLPLLLSELAQAGVDERDIRIVFALGSHRCLKPKEQERLVGPAVLGRFCCGDTSGEPFVQVGHTRRGTPVQVFRPVAEADWRVYVGNIEYHYFAGYTGGAKALLPGVTSVETITANHSWMVHDSAVAGRIEGNPVREDIEEGASFVGPSFLLNVVLDGHYRVVEAVAGDAKLAHREGCRKVDELYRAPIADRADIVLASAGGWPKDINLYQAHKALENAARAVRDDGTIILLAECREGIGHPRFAEWLTCGDAPAELLRRIKERFVLGGHKAAAIAKILRRGVRVFLVSSLDAQTVQAMGFVACSSAQEALALAHAEMGRAATVAVMPHAGSTLPAVRQS
ncbi:MAG: nickel-dependent lactate racemase [Anaerolineales bacterium]|nr:MAG: nickel-dependent lactate racemase [Anaerolineales bacterium]